jgi:hypothetical protein
MTILIEYVLLKMSIFLFIFYNIWKVSKFEVEFDRFQKKLKSGPARENLKDFENWLSLESRPIH